MPAEPILYVQMAWAQVTLLWTTASSVNQGSKGLGLPHSSSGQRLNISEDSELMEESAPFPAPWKENRILGRKTEMSVVHHSEPGKLKKRHRNIKYNFSIKLKTSLTMLFIALFASFYNL